VQATHALVLVLHTGVDPVHVVSSAQASQSPAFVPVVTQVAERQTVAPFMLVHGPSPLAYPQRLSVVSQTPLAHASAPAAAVHIPLSVGELCGGSVGTGIPFATAGVHACVVSLHQSPAGQSASTLHPPAGSHRPLVLHVSDRQTMLAFAAVQGPSPFA
jgi:hypothetical protein